MIDGRIKHTIIRLKNSDLIISEEDIENIDLSTHETSVRLTSIGSQLD